MDFYELVFRSLRLTFMWIYIYFDDSEDKGKIESV